MEPTLHEGDHVYTTMLPYLFGEPKIGDIVIVDISLTGKPSYFHMFGQVLRRNAITSLILGKKISMWTPAGSSVSLVLQEMN